MNRLIADGLWRIARLGALFWIGWEFHGLREDMKEPVDAQATASTEPGVLKNSLDVLHDDIEDLRQRMDGILVAVTRSRKAPTLPATVDDPGTWQHRLMLAIFAH